MREKIIVIGIGNALRRDDGFGIHVARHIAEMDLPGVTVIEHSGDGTSLMTIWQDAGLVIVVDASKSDGKPGTMHRFDIDHTTVPFNFMSFSTHAFSLAESIVLSKTLGHALPPMIVYGVDGYDFHDGEGLSRPVKSKVGEVLIHVMQDILTYKNTLTDEKTVRSV
ncbi:MAG: hydrogenase maturation protease [Bacteroidetes bacterium]|nr:hydrogenase maturation protease [Bacteroidota bacterium]